MGKQQGGLLTASFKGAFRPLLWTECWSRPYLGAALNLRFLFCKTGACHAFL